MTWLFFGAGLFAVVNWYAVTATNKKLEYVAKPLTMILLISAFFTRLSWPISVWEVLFGTGLVFSLIGDVFLMSPGDQFVKGLAAFFLAQLTYIGALNFEGVHLSTATILMIIAIALIAFPVIGSIVNALKESQHQRLVVPVMIYGLALSLMFWSAAATLYRADWTRLSAGLIALGGSAFFFSDSLLAWDRFVRPIPLGRLWTMLSYHIAQFALTFGFLLHWGYL